MTARHHNARSTTAGSAVVGQGSDLTSAFDLVMPVYAPRPRMSHEPREMSADVNPDAGHHRAACAAHTITPHNQARHIMHCMLAPTCDAGNSGFWNVEDGEVPIAE